MDCKRKPTQRVSWRKQNLIGCVVRVGFSLLCVILMVMGISMLVMFYASLGVLGVVLRTNFNHRLRHPSPLVPIWYEIPDDLNYDDWISPLRSASLTLFLIPLLQGVMGSLLICHPKPWLSAVIGIVGIVAIVLQSINFVHLYYLTGATHQSAIRELKRIITENYEVIPGNPQSAALNAIMIMGECCGIEGPDDFKRARLTVNLTSGVKTFSKVEVPTWMDLEYEIPDLNISYQATFKHPPACCSSAVFKIHDEKTRFLEAAKCASLENSTHLITNGCYSHYFNTYIRSGVSLGFYTSLTIGMKACMVLTLVFGAVVDLVDNKNSRIGIAYINVLWTLSGIMTPFVVEDAILE